MSTLRQTVIQEELKFLRKERTKHRKELIKLTGHVLQALSAIDIEMKKPSTHERGQRIAQICGSGSVYEL